MASLPTGTVTFLFSDVEGSTELVRTAGGAYAGLLADVRRLLREEIAANGGAEVVNAAAEGKRAARGIHAWLAGKGGPS